MLTPRDLRSVTHEGWAEHLPLVRDRSGSRRNDGAVGALDVPVAFGVFPGAVAAFFVPIVFAAEGCTVAGGGVLGVAPWCDVIGLALVGGDLASGPYTGCVECSDECA